MTVAQREVLLTLTADEYRAFERDLKTLRDDGAVSNTSVVLEAVAVAAWATRKTLDLPNP